MPVDECVFTVCRLERTKVTVNRRSIRQMRGPGIQAELPGTQTDYAGAEGNQDFACGWVYIYIYIYLYLLLEEAPFLWQSGHDSVFCQCLHVVGGSKWRVDAWLTSH